MLLALHFYFAADHIATVPRYNGTTYTGRVSVRPPTISCHVVWL